MLSDKKFLRARVSSKSTKQLIKSQKKSYNLSSIWRNNIVFNFFLNTERVMFLSRISRGRLFQAVGQATANDLGPKVFVLHPGTKSSPAVAERKFERPGTDDTGMQSFARYVGAWS